MKFTESFYTEVWKIAAEAGNKYFQSDRYHGLRERSNILIVRLRRAYNFLLNCLLAQILSLKFQMPHYYDIFKIIYFVKQNVRVIMSIKYIVEIFI